MAVKLNQKKRKMFKKAQAPVYVLDDQYWISHLQNQGVITVFLRQSNQGTYLFTKEEREKYKLYENFIPLPVMEAATESDVFEKIKEALPKINPRCIFITEDGKVLHTEKENKSFNSARLKELKISE